MTFDSTNNKIWFDDMGSPTFAWSYMRSLAESLQTREAGYVSIGTKAIEVWGNSVDTGTAKLKSQLNEYAIWAKAFQKSLSALHNAAQANKLSLK